MTNDHVGNGLTRFDAILELGVDCPFFRSLSIAYRCKPKNSLHNRYLQVNSKRYLG